MRWAAVVGSARSLGESRCDGGKHDVLPALIRTPLTDRDRVEALGTRAQSVLDLALGPKLLVRKPVLVAEKNGLRDECL